MDASYAMMTTWVCVVSDDASMWRKAYLLGALAALALLLYRCHSTRAEKVKGEQTRGATSSLLVL